MPERLVLDASAALAVLRAEPASGQVRRLLAASDVQRILVPDHFWLEVANVLMRRYRRSPAEVAEAFQALDELEVATAPIDRPLALLALQPIAALGLTAYDAAYLALAEVADADLVTVDRGLAVAAGRRDALGLGASDHRATEGPGAYGSGSALAALAGFGAYLARLRTEASTGEPG